MGPMVKQLEQTEFNYGDGRLNPVSMQPIITSALRELDTEQNVIPPLEVTTLSHKFNLISRLGLLCIMIENSSNHLKKEKQRERFNAKYGSKKTLLNDLWIQWLIRYLFKFPLTNNLALVL